MKLNLSLKALSVLIGMMAALGVSLIIIVIIHTGLHMHAINGIKSGIEGYTLALDYSLGLTLGLTLAAIGMAVLGFSALKNGGVS